jgi:hypothetical protein
MPPRGVKPGSKRARQYEHIKQGERERGTSENRAEEIAARIDGRSKMNKSQLQRAVFGDPVRPRCRAPR